jgi:sugar O-acyltransferase (sialic acid O-acetyltransferase NeuD family)
MLIVGAGGLAAQLFQEIELMHLPNVVFWSETPTKLKFIEEKYRIIKTDEEVIEYFTTVSKEFIIAVGDSVTRKKMTDRFELLGGIPTTFISPFTEISPYVNKIGKGAMLLKDVAMEPGVNIGDGCLLNRKSNYGHGCTIANNTEVGPFAVVSADSYIGEYCLIGIGAIILPRVRIGNHVIVSAGSVVTKNIPDYAVVAGNPAQIRFFRKERDRAQTEKTTAE